MNTKNLFLTGILTIAISCPAFADIAANAPSADCDNGTLGTYQGESTLSAQWTANTINLDFYDGDDKISSGTCTYDAGITLPNDPTKTGYEFSGWRVRAAAAQCDLSGLSDTTAKGKANGYTRLNGATGIKEATYDLTRGSGEWAVEFYHGLVKGQARCSLVGSGMSQGQTGNPTDDLNLNNLSNGARYCWCQMTSYTPKPWVYETGDASSSPIYLTGYTNQSTCKTAIRAITGLNSTDANTFLNNASVNNPQLITNATGANVAYLTDSGCTTSGAASVHFGEIGSTCPVSSSSWVFDYGFDDANDCAYSCASYCASGVFSNAAFRAALFGTAQ